MGAVDVYRITDQLDDATIDVLTARLEHVASILGSRR